MPSILTFKEKELTKLKKLLLLLFNLFVRKSTKKKENIVSKFSVLILF